MYEVHFTEPSEEDLLHTLRYITEVLKAPGAARKLLTATEHQLGVLETLPFSFPLVQDEYLATKGIRALPVNNYLLFYLVSEPDKKVSIIRFLYARRDWITMLKMIDEPAQQ